MPQLNLNCYLFISICFLIFSQISSKVQLSKPLIPKTFLNQLENKLISSSKFQDIFNIASAIKKVTNENEGNILTKHSKNICNKIPNEISSVTDAFYCQRLVELFNCELEINENLKLDIIYERAIEKTIDLSNLQKAVAVLRKSKFLTPENKNKIYENLINVSNNSDQSLLASALGTIIYNELKSHTKLEKPNFSKNLVANFIKSSQEFDFNKIQIDSNSYEIYSILVKAIVGLKSSDERLLTNDEILKIANFFLNVNTKETSNLAFSIHALSALNYDLSDLPKPVSFKKSGSFPNFVFKMTDVFGNLVESARFNIKIDQNSPIIDVPANGLTDLSNLELEPGFHTCTVGVSGSDSFTIDPEMLNFKFSKKLNSKFQIKNEEISVVFKGNIESEKLQKNDVVKAGDKIAIKFDFIDENRNGFELNQAFVRYSLKTENSKEREVFSLLKFGKKGYSVNLSIEKEAFKTFGGASGDWKIQAILGDDSLKTNIIKDLGILKLRLNSDYIEPTIDQVVTENYSPLNLISHTFKEPDTRPPKTVSFIFTVIVLLPILILIIGWPLIGLNFKLFSFNLSGLIFHTSFTLILFLYVLYWLELSFFQLNMFETLHYFGILGFFCVLSGHKLLSTLANDRRNLIVKGKKSN